jgi:thymidylate kinase
MDDCQVPVMVSFHNLTGSKSSFQFIEAFKHDSLMTVLSSQGPEDWLPSDVITVKASSSRSGSFDKFSLSNTAGLVGRILKTDVIWLIFEKASKVTTLPIKNAFDLLKSAANSKVLPEPIQNPFNQKQTLFNTVLGFLKNQNVTFNKADCMGRVKNQRTGAATELVYEVTEIVWKVGQVEKQLRSSSLWSRVPKIISDLATFEVKSKDPIHMTQTSTRTFATHIREVASKALMASQNLTDLKLALLSCAEIFIKYSEYLRVHLEKVKNKAASDRSISTATEALLLQLSNREKVSLVEVGEKPLQNETVISIFTKLDESGLYNPVNISTILPTNRYSRSTIIHRDLPNQARRKFVLWTFDNGRAAPQSIFAFLVDPDDSLQTILEKTNKLKPNLQKLQKFYYPREFYSQFYDQIGAVTGISSQDLKLVCSMVMGDDRKFDGEVKKRFEEAVMSGDPEYVYDMRNFNGSDIKYKDYLAEFRRAVQEYMVEDRGRHETKYDGTVISKVSFGFSIKQMFKTVCEKVREKNPNCPLPKSEHMITRYLIPRTKAAAESACQSEPLIPLKLAMQQKVIEKPNVDAHYNAAQYKYLKSFAAKLGPELVSMVGWDDKTGVDVGEPEQPTVATQHAGKSWVHKEKVVAEGQHSFHKTNLTPSVRLVHEIGSSVEDSFYRGLPQVVIKDAIFQHSTSARHSTELFQMYKENPHLAKPVLILTNDGGNDHTIRHDRNIVSMLALFLSLPDTLFLVNFQLAAYRSAYHPVEKLNCILNLAWNGVALSREFLEDPVLEKVFSQCNSMSDVRAAAERHPGIKPALQKSLDHSIEILEERAKQASLKENSFETFKPATEQDIRDFLSVVLTIDPGFDVERYLDKKKPFHMSPLVKAYIEDHMTSTYYSLTFMKHPTMTEVFLRESYPTLDWPAGLEPLPCPIVDKENPEKYLSYEKVSDLLVKDYSDSSRPGAVKTPSNIPFTKSKPRAFFGAKLNITCDVCSKSRVAYIEHRPSEAVLGTAKKALLNVKYICGGRIASFGRSLTVLEEIYDATTGGTEVLDEIELDRPSGREMNIIASTSFDVIDEFDDFLFSPGPVRKKKKMIIESDDSESEEEPNPEVETNEKNSDVDTQSPPWQSSWGGGRLSGTGCSPATTPGCEGEELNQEVILSNSEQSMSVAEDTKPPCSFCGKFETSHKCRECKAPCCNICNTFGDVEEVSDIVCPDCRKSVSEEPVPKKRGRPRKKVNTGAILIPLTKRGRGRPPKVIEAHESETDQEDDNNNEAPQTFVEEAIETEVSQSTLTELRILGTGSVLKKIFVDESLTCDSPVEPHMFDILIDRKKPLPCSHCGETEESRIFSKLMDDCFPLCISCHAKGRGAGLRRKSRKILPKAIKKTKPKATDNRMKRPRKPLLD